MLRPRSSVALLLSVLLAAGSSACAQAGGEIIRTAPPGAPAQAAAAAVAVPSTAETFDAISAAVDAAAEDWNSGDIDRVMSTYVDDEPLLVFLGDTPLKGPESVRAALEAQAARPGGLGALSYEWFETLQFDVNTAVVSGRAVLTRDGRAHRGLFTRILRRTSDGWLIVHDQLAWGPVA